MRLFLIINLCVICSFKYKLNAQKTFSVRLNPIENTEDGQQIEILENNIFVGAFANYRVNNIKKIGYTLYLTDMNGKEIKNKFYPNLFSPSQNSVSAITKDRIYFLANDNYNEPQLKQKIVINELNHNLDSINVFSFEPTGKHLVSCITQYSDTELLILLKDYNGTNNYLSLIDRETGTVKWTSTLVNETIMKCLSSGKIIVDNDKNIIVLNKIIKKGIDLPGDSRPLLTKFDSKGKKIFSLDFPEVAVTKLFNSLSILDTATYIFACGGDDNVPGHGGDTIEGPPVFYAINKDGSVKWKKYIYGTYPNGFTEMSGFTIAKNGDIIGVGSKEDNDKKPRTSGWLFRLSHDGKMKWTRTIRDENGLSTAKAIVAGDLYDVKESANGMLYATGLYMDTFPNYKPFINNNNVWLIGVDSMGCFVPNCGEKQLWTDIDDALLLTFEQPFKIYPNPAKDIIHVLSLSDFGNIEKVIYEIYDLEGRLIQRNQLLNTTSILNINLPPLISGSYLLNIQANKTNKSFLFYKI
jgi:hypothetical protein